MEEPLNGRSVKKKKRKKRKEKKKTIGLKVVLSRVIFISLLFFLSPFFSLISFHSFFFLFFISHWTSRSTTRGGRGGGGSRRNVKIDGSSFSFNREGGQDFFFYSFVGSKIRHLFSFFIRALSFFCIYFFFLFLPRSPPPSPICHTFLAYLYK